MSVNRLYFVVRFVSPRLVSGKGYSSRGEGTRL